MTPPADRDVVLRTGRPPAEALDDLAALLDARLARGGPLVLRCGRGRSASGIGRLVGVEIAHEPRQFPAAAVRAAADGLRPIGA